MTSTLSRDAKVMLWQGRFEESLGGDGRAHPIRMARTGSRLLEKCLPAWRAALAKAKKLLGDEGTAALFRAAGARCQALEVR
jgi:hypothetical protein